MDPCKHLWCDTCRELLRTRVCQSTHADTDHDADRCNVDGDHTVGQPEHQHVLMMTTPRHEMLEFVRAPELAPITTWTDAALMVTTQFGTRTSSHSGYKLPRGTPPPPKPRPSTKKEGDQQQMYSHEYGHPEHRCCKSTWTLANTYGATPAA
jgi:hypothetical protein